MINPSSSFLLMVGDDASILFPPLGESKLTALFAHHHHQEDTEAIIRMIVSSPKTPVILLSDTQAQSYKIDEMPQVSVFDRQKLMQRRLVNAFPDATYKSAIRLGKHKVLQTAMNANASIDRWMEKLEALPNPSGILGLLPYECADMVQRLVPAARQGWGLLLCHHITGGLRQIVVHRGVFQFTRLTQPIASGSSTGFQTASIAADIQATREYLARFGLTSETPLHMAAIVPSALREALSVTPLNVAWRNVMSQQEAAEKLQLPFAPQANEDIADLISLLWVATGFSLRNPLMTPVTHKAQKTRMIQRVGYTLALCLFLVALVLFGFKSFDLLALRMDVMNTQEEVAVLQKELQVTQATLAPETAPLGRLRLAAERRRLFQSADTELLDLLPPITSALGENLHTVRLKWSEKTLHLTLQPSDRKSFISGAFQSHIDEVHNRLAAALPDYKITRTDAAGASSATSALSNKSPAAEKTEPTVSFTFVKGAP